MHTPLDARAVARARVTWPLSLWACSRSAARIEVAQRALTPAQVISADGCHLDRRTLETIKAAERFKEVDATYFDLQGFYILNPTVAGIARV